MQHFLILTIGAAFMASNTAWSQTAPQTYSDTVRVDGKVMTYVERMPVFPGGQAALFQTIGQNISYPTEALQQRLEGRVFVSFVVGTSGSVQEVKVSKSVHPVLDAEAVRAVGKLPAWQPGRQNGRLVPVSFTLPIGFRLPANVEQVLAERAKAATDSSSSKTAALVSAATPPPAEPVYTSVQYMPVPPGGMAQLPKYLASALQYPAEARKNRIQGQVLVNFVVDTKGQVQHVVLARSAHPLLDAEALRVVSTMPAWKPGQLNGRLVNVAQTVPVDFKLK